MQNSENKWQCRIAPSLGDGFAGHPNEVWGTVPYTDPTKPCVFFGMYGMSDLQALSNHIGKRAILWAGSDIKNFLNGYWLDRVGKYKTGTNEGIFRWATHYVENSLEQIALLSVGVESRIIPSFLGNIKKYKPQKIASKPRYYTTVSGDDFELYGWTEIPKLMEQHPDWEIHLYGHRDDEALYEKVFNIKKPNTWKLNKKDEFASAVIHGRVSQEQMDEETKTMTGALRLTRFDGFSEILAKSILWGQKPISPYIHYPFLNDRDQFLSVVNKYPWNVNLN